MGPLMLGTIEFALALPFALVWAAATGTHRHLGRLSARDWLLMVLQSVLTIAAIATLWLGLRTVPPTTAAFLGRLEVLVAVGFAMIALGDRHGPLALAGGAISFGGVLIMRWEAPPELRAGTWLVVASAFSFAAAEVAATSLARRVPSSLFLFVRTPMVTVLFAGALLAVAIHEGRPPAWPGPTGFLLALALAICGPVLARTFYFSALRRTTLSRAALVNQSQPLLVVLLALLVYGTLPGLRETLGGLLVLGGTVLLVASSPERPRSPSM
jgi:drug/metabolite transporter (DMT)-like permease